MAEDSEKAKLPAGEEADEIRKRFASLQGAAAGDSIPHDELPPVPETKIERPGQNPQRATRLSGFQSTGDRPPVTRGMYGGGEMRSSGQALTIGTGLVGSIIVGTGLGWLVDKYILHSTGTPWGLVCGFMLGVASGFIQLVRVANQLNKD